MAMRKRFSVEVLPDVDPSAIIIDALADTDRFADAAKLASPDRERLAVVIEELLSNAARHAAGADGIRVTVTLTGEADGIVVQVDDDGAAFDPRERRAFAGPDLQTGGGVGLELVRAWCDPMVYRREGQNNRLELRLSRSR